MKSINQVLLSLVALALLVVPIMTEQAITVLVQPPTALRSVPRPLNPVLRDRAECEAAGGEWLKIGGNWGCWFE